MQVVIVGSEAWGVGRSATDDLMVNVLVKAIAAIPAGWAVHVPMRDGACRAAYCVLDAQRLASVGPAVPRPIHVYPLPVPCDEAEVAITVMSDACSTGPDRCVLMVFHPMPRYSRFCQAFVEVAQQRGVPVCVFGRNTEKDFAAWSAVIGVKNALYGAAPAVRQAASKPAPKPIVTSIHEDDEESA